MLEKTIYSDGKDDFKDGKFSDREWSAPVMVDPKEIKDRIESFSLPGRKIRAMKLIGLSYFTTRDWIEDSAYSKLKELDEDERQKMSNYDNIPADMMFTRNAIVDEPLLIKFEDWDRFEIDTPQDPEFEMSMNCIPWWIKAGTNEPNVDADVLFSPCIGKKIESVAVNTSVIKEDPMFHSPFDHEPFEREVVTDITLCLEDGIKLCIEPYIDYCSITCVEGDEASKISFVDLKEALFNYEDIHQDTVTGYEARRGVYFGEKGAERAGQPFIRFYSSSKPDSIMYIDYDEFVFLSFIFIKKIGDFYDEYEDYKYSAKEWNEILELGKTLIEKETFDELYDELVSWNITSRSGTNVLVFLLNNFGAEYWRNKKFYEVQFEDICKWSEIVLNENAEMNIIGY